MNSFFVKPIRNSNKFQSNYRDSHQSFALISNKSIRMNQLMKMYERLRLSCADLATIEKVILFLVGVIYVPGSDVHESSSIRKMVIASCENDGFDITSLTFSPLILFPRLSCKDGWSIKKPPKEFHELYIEQLAIANNAVHTVKIAHLDEYPANIMWRRINMDSVSSKVILELKLIDFDDAVYFDHPIPESFVSIIIGSFDYRYPFKDW